jgi:hypothetical protein
MLTSVEALTLAVVLIYNEMVTLATPERGFIGIS